MLIESAYREYSAQMLGAMLRFSRDEAAAGDAVSQAFMQAMANRSLLEAMPEPAMKAWLYAAARNALIDMKRKEARTVCVEEPSGAEEMEIDPGDRILAQELMNRLPQNLKLPVYLKYYQDYNSAEIGRIMNLPAATVRTRLRTALQMMREMMKGEF